ncbi:DnaJ C-terminal domain-containing protein [Streptomyces ardesiacus]|uniref:DnaJ C-terminal domain-containing protein n=1 Tax=unclassified Streptomyces TaxID=2593676 RepID=UPI0004C5EEC8|nr:MULTISPECIES: DnaJ C-terminal domain-containing protein [unclassified Streptomyces]KOX32659.1 hypothetical protein ADL07_10615 [Streptomyces sp. NRRL F-4707]
MDNGPSGARYLAIVLGFLTFAFSASLLLTDVPNPGKWLGAGIGMAGGAAVFVGACILNARSARCGKPWLVKASVTLTSDEARQGALKAVSFKARVRCAVCDGTGRSGPSSCRKCRGSGLGKFGQHTRRIHIPAGVQDNSELTVRSMGAPGGRQNPNGDLLLAVRITGGGGKEPRRQHGKSAGEERRDPRIRRPHDRSVSDDAFLITVVGNPRPHRPGPEPADRVRPAGPATARNRQGDTEVALTSAGMVVRDKWPRPGGGARWRTRVDLRWDDIAGLGFDYGSHDSVVSLWAVSPHGEQRQHIVDARSFTRDQWDELGRSTSALTGGRLTIDLAKLDHPGTARDS